MGNRPDHLAELDGLRAVAALSVFVSHAGLYPHYLATGRWELVGPVFTVLGQGGVALFFMITGFLFWGRLLRAHGRPDWRALYIGRLFRIGPLYLLAAAILVAEAFASTGWRLHVPVGQLAASIAAWSALGMGPMPPVNGFADTPNLIAGVTWTLAYEWWFYLALLPLSVFARNFVLGLWAPVSALVVVLAVAATQQAAAASAGPSQCIAAFAAGMSIAALRTRAPKFRLERSVTSVAGGALLLSLFLFPNALGAPQIVLAAAAFWLIVGGGLRPILCSPIATRLGDISYGIYLLQGLVLAALFMIPGARAFDLSSPTCHWLLMGSALLCLLGTAAAAHVMVEKPGIAAGRCLARQRAESATQEEQTAGRRYEPIRPMS